MLKSKIKKSIIVGMASVALTAGVPSPAYAADFALFQAIDLVTNLFDKSNEYKEARKQLKEFGGSISAQSKNINNALSTYGADKDEERSRFVGRVASRLIQDGNYVLKPDSLPFLYTINNSMDWNANCDITNHISFNKGLVMDLAHSEDAFAAIMAHEMEHGIQQHIIQEYSEKFVSQNALALVTEAVTMNEWQSRLFDIVSNYALVKNTTNKFEGEADERGFYLMTSAGFNPGGFPIAMRHLATVGNGYNPNMVQDLMRPSDHPSNNKRFERGVKRMEKYGFNHASVKNGNQVFVDNEYLLTASPYEKLADWENAYLIAGGISKAFHDKSSYSLWFFSDENGKQDFLPDEGNAYASLKHAVLQDNTLTARFQKMIMDAYEKDMKNNVRAKGNSEEKSFLEENEVFRKSAEDPKNLNKYLRSANEALGMGYYASANLQAKRGLKIDPENLNALQVAGASKIQMGNNKDAIESLAKAVEVSTKRNDKTGQAWALALMAKAEVSLNNKADAKRDIARVMEISGNDSDYAMFAKGVVADMEGKKLEAMNFFNRSLSMKPYAPKEYKETK